MTTDTDLDDLLAATFDLQHSAAGMRVPLGDETFFLMAQLATVDDLFRQLLFVRIVERIGMTGDAIRLVRIQSFSILRSRMDAVVVQIGNRFVAE